MLAIGSDLDGVQTQNFTQPQPETLIAVSLEAPVNYRVDVQLDRRRGRRRSRPDRRPSASTACSSRSPSASRRRAPRPATTLDADRTALPRRDPLRGSGRRRPRRRHVHPGLLARRLPHARRPAAPAGAARLGDARLRLPGGARRGARGRRPGRLDLGRRRLPLRLRRARHDGPGADPADRRDRRRRRLRHAALRPGRAGDESYGVDLHTPDFEAMATSFGVRAETVDGLDDAFGEALARHVADRARRCSWHGPRCLWCRLRTPRRTGTANGGRCSAPTPGGAVALPPRCSPLRLPTARSQRWRSTARSCR